MSCVVYTSTALDLCNNRHVHIALLREFLLSEFLFASRSSYGVAGDLRDVLGFFCIIVLAVVAATTADAEFTFDVLAIAVLGVVVWVFDFDFDNVTVVQSWQSGTSGSGVLYLFFDMTGWWTAGEGRWMDEEVVCIVSRDRFISVYRTDTDIDAIIV